MKSQRDDAPITVWCGNHRFGRDDSFFPSVVTVARKYADKEPTERPSDVRFHEALKGLRDIAPVGGHVLLDQLEHRWRHPHCPPSLYVLALTLCAPDRGGLLAESGQLVQELLCTKIGQTKRTVAGRLPAYKTQLLGGLRIARGSPDLRVLIYGDGSAMLLERELQKVARSIGSRVEVVAMDGRQHFHASDETYVGVEMIDALCTFAQERANGKRLRSA